MKTFCNIIMFKCKLYTYTYICIIKVLNLLSSILRSIMNGSLLEVQIIIDIAIIYASIITCSSNNDSPLE